MHIWLLDIIGQNYDGESQGKSIPHLYFLCLTYHSDEEYGDFYEYLEQTKAQFKLQAIIPVMRNLTAKVGNGKQGNIGGPRGSGKKNER